VFYHPVCGTKNIPHPPLLIKEGSFGFTLFFPPAEATFDAVEDEFQFLKNKVILESYNKDALFLKPAFPLEVVLGSTLAEMDLPVQFDGQLFAVAIEVQYVVPNTVLTPELSAGELGTLQHAPQVRLSRRERSPKLLPPLAQTGLVVNPFPDNASFLTLP
jgi:hypothetical protein